MSTNPVLRQEDRERPEVEAAARAWWELLRSKVGGDVPWEDASEEAKRDVRDYIENGDR